MIPWKEIKPTSVPFPPGLQYFQGRLNTTEWSNGTAVVRTEYYFNNWMTLLSQLPLLVFTLLNSFLYHRSVGRLLAVTSGFFPPHVDVNFPQKPFIELMLCRCSRLCNITNLHV